MKVAGFGESSIDFVYVVEELPRPGVSKLRITGHDSCCGGQVATTMAACAALGLTALYLGPIGNDENGRRIARELSEGGVDVSRTMVRNSASRYAVILVDGRTGERVVFWDRDSQLDVPAEEFDESQLGDARVLHVDATDEAAAITIAGIARAAGAIVTCDIDNVTPRTKELLTRVTMPVLAEHVPQLLTGIGDTEAALRAIRAWHQGLLCVTLGGRGSAALDGDRFVQVPAVPVKTVDTTGAGDVFRAGFIYGVLHEWPAERMLEFANAAAAVSCTRIGAMAGVPNLGEVERQLS